MILYGMFNLEIAEIIEWMNTLEEAEAFIAEVRGDEPELAETLEVVEFEVEVGVNSSPTDESRGVTVGDVPRATHARHNSHHNGATQ